MARSHSDGFFQRASAALFALSDRSALLSFFALAGPPFRPPSRPSATAAGFFFPGLGSGSRPVALATTPNAVSFSSSPFRARRVFFAISRGCQSGHESARLWTRPDSRETIRIGFAVVRLVFIGRSSHALDGTIPFRAFDGSSQQQQVHGGQQHRAQASPPRKRRKAALPALQGTQRGRKVIAQ
jgi:hypothetical protein